MKLLRIGKSFFFGNYFYGVCAVALSVEANLQQALPLNSGWYYAAVFLATVVYYNHAYLSSHLTTPDNPRAQWYQQHHRTIKAVQGLFTLLLALIALLLLQRLRTPWQKLHATDVVLIGIFPLAALWYYGNTLPLKHRMSLRSNGWTKPFVIGFIWAGMVNVYPAIAARLESPFPVQETPHLFNILLFVKNGMYITLLCILFDIKDYATDHNQQLKTFVVRYGLRKTLFWIIIPLAAIGLGTFLSYAFTHQFPPLRILINTLPFILLITVTYHMHRRKSILYYLAIIDGLMLVKALCGISASFIH